MMIMSVLTTSRPSHSYHPLGGDDGTGEVGRAAVAGGDQIGDRCFPMIPSPIKPTFMLSLRCAAGVLAEPIAFQIRTPKFLPAEFRPKRQLHPITKRPAYSALCRRVAQIRRPGGRTTCSLSCMVICRQRSVHKKKLRGTTASVMPSPLLNRRPAKLRGHPPIAELRRANKDRARELDVCG